MGRWRPLGCLLLLSGCTPAGLVRLDLPTPRGPHEMHAQDGPGSLKYLSCDLAYYAGNYGGPPRPDGRPVDGGLAESAATTYLYALMASNAYEADGPQWDIPGWTRTARWAGGKSDLGIDVYRRDGSVPADLVVAFRGTDFDHWQDWKVNFALPPFEPVQAKESADFVARLLRDNPGAHVVATGHSLGGGLALDMSLRFEGVDAFAFNSSPRAFFRAPVRHNHNRRAHVVELGEVLQPFSRTWLRLRLPKMEVWSYNFMDFRFFHSLAPKEEHSMYRLSRGLLLSAMGYGSAAARETFVRNIPRDEAVAADPACAALYD